MNSLNMSLVDGLVIHLSPKFNSCLWRVLASSYSVACTVHRSDTLHSQSPIPAELTEAELISYLVICGGVSELLGGVGVS